MYVSVKNLVWHEMITWCTAEHYLVKSEDRGTLSLPGVEDECTYKSKM